MFFPYFNSSLPYYPPNFVFFLSLSKKRNKKQNQTKTIKKHKTPTKTQNEKTNKRPVRQKVQKQSKMKQKPKTHH